MTRKWRGLKNNPPKLGWYNASVGRFPNVLRWWNGSYWSVAAMSYLTSEEAAIRAQQKANYDEQRFIEWRPLS